MTNHAQYHITFSPPYKANDNWPNGMWAVYRITGDQIAQRIRFDDKGEVVERHSWCGYLGGCDSLNGVKAMIEEDMAALRQSKGGE